MQQMDTATATIKATFKLAALTRDLLKAATEGTPERPIIDDMLSLTLFTEVINSATPAEAGDVASCIAFAVERYQLNPQPISPFNFTPTSVIVSGGSGGSVYRADLLGGVTTDTPLIAYLDTRFAGYKAFTPGTSITFTNNGSGGFDINSAGGGGDVTLAGDNSFTGQNDFTQRLRILDGSGYRTDVTAGALNFVSAGGAAGVLQTSGGYLQLFGNRVKVQDGVDADDVATVGQIQAGVVQNLTSPNATDALSTQGVVDLLPQLAADNQFAGQNDFAQRLRIADIGAINTAEFTSNAARFYDVVGTPAGTAMDASANLVLFGPHVKVQDGVDSNDVATVGQAELKANKTTDLTTNDTLHYPSTGAVVAGIVGATPYTARLISGTVAIGTGSKTTTVTVGKAYIAGQRVRLTDNNSTNYVAGDITAYDIATGVLSFTVASGDFSGMGLLGAGSIATRETSTPVTFASTGEEQAGTITDKASTPGGRTSWFTSIKTLAQTISGLWNFTTSPTVPNATTSTQAMAYGQRLLIGTTTGTAADGATVLTKANNLSDVANAASARANIGAGTVSSVGISVSGVLHSVGAPVTGSGVIPLNLLTQSANKVLAGPTSGGDATPTMRLLVAADIPALPDFALLPPRTTQTGAYTLVAGDAGGVVLVNVASATNITIPNGVLPLGAILYVRPKGAGQLTMVGASGVTVTGVPAGAVKSFGLNYDLCLHQESTNNWLVTGGTV